MATNDSSHFNIVNTELAPKAVGTYSQGVEWNGTYFVSGQIGLDPKTGELKNGFEAQLQQILDNTDGLLTSQNLTRKNIAKSTIFLTDLANFSQVNQAYEKFFTPPYPARSCVQVPALPKGALIEIEIIAIRN